MAEFFAEEVIRSWARKLTRRAQRAGKSASLHLDTTGLPPGTTFRRSYLEPHEIAASPLLQEMGKDGRLSFPKAKSTNSDGGAATGAAAAMVVTAGAAAGWMNSHIPVEFEYSSRVVHAVLTRWGRFETEVKTAAAAAARRRDEMEAKMRAHAKARAAAAWGKGGGWGLLATDVALRGSRANLGWPGSSLPRSFSLSAPHAAASPSLTSVSQLIAPLRRSAAALPPHTAQGGHPTHANGVGGGAIPALDIRRLTGIPQPDTGGGREGSAGGPHHYVRLNDNETDSYTRGRGAPAHTGGGGGPGMRTGEGPGTLRRGASMAAVAATAALSRMNSIIFSPSVSEGPGDRCFVTFRYASDAERARGAWRAWDTLGALISTMLFCVAVRRPSTPKDSRPTLAPPKAFLTTQGDHRILLTTGSPPQNLKHTNTKDIRCPAAPNAAWRLACGPVLSRCSRGALTSSRPPLPPAPPCRPLWPATGWAFPS